MCMDYILSCEGCTASPDEASVRLFNRHTLGLYELGFHILQDSSSQSTHLFRAR
jgi:hypothetical protein